MNVDNEKRKERDHHWVRHKGTCDENILGIYI